VGDVISPKPSRRRRADEEKRDCERATCYLSDDITFNVSLNAFKLSSIQYYDHLVCLPFDHYNTGKQSIRNKHGEDPAGPVVLDIGLLRYKIGFKD
jgi:hypothetical protein